MARDRPLSSGALAAARWPDELEKNPIRVFAVLGWLVVQGFVLLGWAGWRMFQGLMLLGWTVFRVVQFVVQLPALLLFFFSAVYGTPSGTLYAVPSRRWTSIRSLLWSNFIRPISSPPCCGGTTFHPSLPSCCAGLFPSPFGRSWLEGRRRDFRALRQAPAVAAFTRPKGSGYRHRGGSSSGRGAGDF